VRKVLKDLALLNLFEVPKILLDLVCGQQQESVQELVKKGYIFETESSYRFASRTMLTALRKNIKIGRAERNFYRDVVTKLSSTNAEIYQLNKHWLLLSYINLGGIVDKRLNSFLFSSAVYMEKLGFFEISQRSYQTIISSFESDNPFDDFKILPEIKSARLWRFVDPQWGKLFWEKLENYAHRKNNQHLELLAKSELLILEREKVDFRSVADLLKKMHLSGLYEDEISLIDKTTDILMSSGNYIDANTFAVRAYKILRDVITRYDGKGVPPADFIYVLFVRCCCKLSEVCIMLGDYDKATAILEEALEYADRYEISYFKSKVQFLLGKIKFESKDKLWVDYMKDGFYNSIIGMDFAIIKSFLYFFEKNELENEEWVSPFLEYKNWINF
jgi:tetratricopeptide (TPR) repeat protein